MRSEKTSPLEEQFKIYNREQYKLPLEVADKNQQQKSSRKTYNREQFKLPLEIAEHNHR